MQLEPGRFTAVVLAAQRRGERDPLACRSGVSHKCLVPIAGKPLIAHVAATLAATPGLDRIRICIEAEAVEEISRALGPLASHVDFVPAASNLADSVYACAKHVSGILLVTTADNVLLSSDAILAVLAAHDAGAEVVVALTSRDKVLAAHPEGQRRFYCFADDSYSNCNLYGLWGSRALRAAEAFRGGGRFNKNPMRIVTAFGLLNLILLRLGWISLAGAMERISRRFRVEIKAIILDDGAHAIDVDNDRTYAIAAHLLEQRRCRPIASAREQQRADLQFSV